MDKKFAVLPCNGLDKCAGSISRQVALDMQNKGHEIICPVFYRVAENKYNAIANKNPLIVVDGCGTRCASKLAAEKGLKITQRVVISEEAKAASLELGGSLELGKEEYALAEAVCNKLTAEKELQKENNNLVLPQELDYEVYKKDKFIFRVPKNEGFLFNENDAWVYIQNGKARIGVTDYVQQSLSDIIFYEPVALGTKVEQFDAVGEVESAKAVFELVSPVSGTVVAVNAALEDAPEKINKSPYEQGWLVEIELENFEEDKDMLHDFKGYFPVLKRKVDEFNA